MSEQNISIQSEMGGSASVATNEHPYIVLLHIGAGTHSHTNEASNLRVASRYTLHLFPVGSFLILLAHVSKQC
jgi:hypothetical protein